jgi:hypothetical protein
MFKNSIPKKYQGTKLNFFLQKDREKIKSEIKLTRNKIYKKIKKKTENTKIFLVGLKNFFYFITK